MASILIAEGKDQHVICDTDVTNDRSASFVLNPEDEVHTVAAQQMEIETVGRHFFTTE